MKRFLAGLGLLLAFFLPIATSQALTQAGKAPTAGGACTSINAKAKSGSTTLICRVVGKKKVWQKTAPASKPSHVASATPTVTPSTPSSSPSPTISQSNSPSLTAQNSYETNVIEKAFSFSFTYVVAGEKSVRLGTEPTLYLPVGKPVQLNIASLDTPHGFWVPALGIDKEASPDTTTHLTITAEKIGKFPGACNIQCGRGHTGMSLTAEVVSEADYLKIIGALKAN